MSSPCLGLEGQVLGLGLEAQVLVNNTAYYLKYLKNSSLQECSSKEAFEHCTEQSSEELYPHHQVVTKQLKFSLEACKGIVYNLYR